MNDDEIILPSELPSPYEDVTSFYGSKEDTVAFEKGVANRKIRNTKKQELYKKEVAEQQARLAAKNKSL